MENQQPFIIHTRRGAMVALCIGLLLALSNFHHLFGVYFPGHASGFTLYHLPHPPTSFDKAVYVWGAIVSAGAFVFVLFRSRSWKRVYLAIFAGAASLGPLNDIQALASIHLVAWIASIAELGMIPSALRMYKILPPYRSTVDGSEAGSALTR